MLSFCSNLQSFLNVIVCFAIHLLFHRKENGKAIGAQFNAGKTTEVVVILGVACQYCYIAFFFVYCCLLT